MIRNQRLTLLGVALPLLAASCGAGVAGSFCVNGPVSIDLDATPAAGLHLVQVQNPAGPISNELPICVGAAANCN